MEPGSGTGFAGDKESEPEAVFMERAEVPNAIVTL